VGRKTFRGESRRGTSLNYLSFGPKVSAIPPFGHPPKIPHSDILLGLLRELEYLVWENYTNYSKTLHKNAVAKNLKLPEFRQLKWEVSWRFEAPSA